MIPKIIHYTWFSGEDFPTQIKMCIESWHKYMPEYNFICWDSEKIKEIESVWLSETLKEKKWAFAADFVRLYAIYNYGGIYLDTDCLLYNSLDRFLNEDCFIGKENSIHVEGRNTEMYMTSHCFGAVDHNEFIGKCLSYYNNRHFKLSEDDSLPMALKYSTLLLPFIQSEIGKLYGYNPHPSKNVIQKLDYLTVFPSMFFDVTSIDDNSYCKHLALGGWREYRTAEERPTLAYKIRWRIERLFMYLANSFGYLLVKKQ